MLACRPNGAANFTVLAHAPRIPVITDIGQSNSPTVANGTGWYYDDAYSWGFARQGDPLVRNSCDTDNTNAAQRLCWHTGNNTINSGWRCGASTSIGAGWERVVLHAD